MLTLKQLFDYTPPANGDLFKNCHLRLPNDYDYEQLNQSACGQYFSIRKFYIGEYICYKFHVRHKMTDRYYSHRKLSHALKYQGMIYKFYFSNLAFKTAQRIKLVLNENDDDKYPIESIGYVGGINRIYNTTTESAEKSLIIVGYITIARQVLPLPYSTSCFDYTTLKLLSRNDCFDKCLRNLTIERLKKVPFSIITTERLDIRHLNTNDFRKNRTLARMNDKIEAECGSKCQKPDCLTKKYFNRIETEKRANFGVHLNIPSEPSFTMKCIAKMYLTEVLVYVLSCLGIWFGLSISRIGDWVFDHFDKIGSKGSLNDGKVIYFNQSMNPNHRKEKLFIPMRKVQFISKR